MVIKLSLKNTEPKVLILKTCFKCREKGGPRKMGILSRLFGKKHLESCKCPECAPEKPKKAVKKKVKKKK